MNKNLKRYLISTSETFAVTFWVTFFAMLDTALSTWNIDKAVLLSILMASLISATKVIVKWFREFLSDYKQK